MRIITLGLAGLLLVAAPASAQYIGDFCWAYSSLSGAGTIHAGVDHVGNGRYQLIGTIASTSPTADTMPATAIAVSIGSAIELTIIAASDGPSAIIQNIMWAALDPATLNGTYRTAALQMSAAGLYYGYDTGSVFRVTCP
jgi:hypothetical protein